MTPLVTSDGAIKRFADSGLQAAMEKQLAALDPNDTAAFVGVATLDGAKAFAVVRLKHGWSVMGALEKEWKGDLKAEVAIGWRG